MERVQRVLSHPDFDAYMFLNKQQETGREFCCHQLEHALDVARIFYILCLEGDRTGSLPDLKELSGQETKELVYAIALLHDIGRWKQYLDRSLDHASEGAVLARPILQDAGFNDREIDLALKAIAAHRDSQAPGLGSFLYRADKLSRNCHHCPAQDKCYKFNRMETRDKLLY
ncbi:HD domain-containing protein [Dehalobacterium formicoaceticum]|uniref:HD domain-containing protein n=1 Tax=Dehalobacterium formicoaceticum TaxID=51515 RepID=UPI0031F71D85